MRAIAKALAAGFRKDWSWRLLHAGGRAVVVLLPLIATAHPATIPVVHMLPLFRNL